MIEYLHGLLIRKATEQVIINVAGVGYGIHVGKTCFVSLPEVGQEVALWVTMRMREEHPHLYGFLTCEEKEVFAVLLTVSGVGPKVGMAILEALGVQGLADAVVRQDQRALLTISGVGKRGAEKLMVELKSKVERLQEIAVRLGVRHPGTARAVDSDTALQVRTVLASLGVRERDALCVLEQLDTGSERDLSVVVQDAFRILGRMNSASLEGTTLGF